MCRAELKLVSDLVTRILYRLRFSSEQRPFDSVSLAYIMPLVFSVLNNQGLGLSAADDVDEQLTLAFEFISFHIDNCRLPYLPNEIGGSNFVWFGSFRCAFTQSQAFHDPVGVDATIWTAL